MSDIRKTLILTFFFLFFFSLISNVYATLIPGCVDILRPGIYYLTQDIINSIDDVCIDIQADNVILDCQGHLIDGVGAPASIGILVHGLHITIMNCYLNDWYEGIYVVNSFSNSIINIHGDTVGAMVHLEASNDNTISNVEGGVHLQFSNHNTISDVSGGNPSVYLEASDDNTISNVEGGVHLEASNDNTISDVSGGNPSVYLEASNDNTISNVQAEGCWRGIDMRSSNNNEISNSQVTGCDDVGINIEFSNGNVIRDSIIQNNNCGIRIIFSQDNQIFNNIFNNSNNFCFEGEIFPNYWNTTLQPGTNIVGGPYIGGNYWGKPDGTGFSDTCSDGNNDGICDNPYTLARDNIDYLPLAKYVAPPAPSYTEITNCTTITEPGEYRLANDITTNATVCIDIQANNVVFDCQGHSIYGAGAYNYDNYGIHVNGSSHVTIRNCNLYNWLEGVYVENSVDSEITHIHGDTIDVIIFLVNSSSNTISDVGGAVCLYSSNNNIISGVRAKGVCDGVYLYKSNYNIIRDSIFQDNYCDGIGIGESNGNEIRDSIIQNSVFGIIICDSNNSIIRDSIIQDSFYGGIAIEESKGTQIFNNILNNTSNFYFPAGGVIYTNYWNTTLQEGTNIWNSSLGYIGGNLWTTPDNNGYSDNCVDANFDGFCDDPYTITSDDSNIDYLPIAKYVGQNAPSPPAPSYTEISSCMQITEPGEYRLTQDIINSTDDVCIDIQADNVILDCQGHLIDGVNAPYSYGIYVNGFSHVTIMNCYLNDWYEGIYVENSFSNSIINIHGYTAGVALVHLISSNGNTISDVSGKINIEYSINNRLSNIVSHGPGIGIDIEYSDYNEISNSQIIGCEDTGLYMYSSSNNRISNVSLYGNGVGMYLGSSNNNIIIDSIIQSRGSGIYLESSEDNIIIDSIIENSSFCGISIYLSQNNQIYNNIFNNSNNLCFFGEIYTNYWNTTLQPGTNIWNSSLGYIGGNLWTTPDNNGYSDTCVDANFDGFCDDPYYLTSDGSNIDYLPIAKYVGQNAPPPSFSVVFNYNSVDFGTVTPYTIAEAKSISYNVSITSASDYKVSASATDWSGPTTIPANTLYFAVNDTLDKLSFETAKQLSNSVQLIATFPYSVTTNYHAFYFEVPLVPPGTYTATITITYEVM